MGGLARLFGRAPRRAPDPLPDAPPELRALIERVRPFTMTSPERLAAVWEAVRYLTRAGIAGDFVECGVWRGGSSMAAALTLLALGDSARRLHLFDTFAGMTPPTDADREAVSGRAAGELIASDFGGDPGAFCHASIEDVARNMASTGYPAARVALVQGPVERTIPAQAPERIALLRLDTDWYESTRHELEQLYPRLAVGGVLIIDDYGHWEGARRAVDEYVAAHRLRLLLNRIDYTGRIAIRLE